MPFANVFKIVGFIVVLVMLGWFIRPTSIPDDDHGLSVITPVERDFDQIMESGVIRLVTRYNSQTYFLQEGTERGFEFDFFSAFARQHGLRVEVVIPNEDEHPIDVLNRGDGDVIAANFAVTEERERFIGFSHPYNLVTEILIVHENEVDMYPDVESLSGLTIHVRRNSSYYTSLRRLQQSGIDLVIETVPETIDTEALLGLVSSGEILATVADDNLYTAASIFIRNIAAGPSVAETNPVAWGIRKNSVELGLRMNDFISTHFQVREEDGEYRRSELMNVLRARYYENPRAVLHNRWQVRNKTTRGLLSPYDDMARRVAESVGIDWKLIIAVIAQESRFDPQAVSWMGAVGLMQIIPKYSELDTDSLLFDEEANMREGARILKQHLVHFAYLDSVNQMRFALASYNAGIGHVADARQLAIDLNKNPNDWDGVQESLLMLMNREHYKHAKYGFVRGIETVNYVNSILNRYKTYDMLLARASIDV